MNKQELIERIQDLYSNLEAYKNEAFMISEEIENTKEEWNEISNSLEEADSYLDNCLDELEEALAKAMELPEFENTATFDEVCEKFIPNRILCNAIKDVDNDLLCNGIEGNEQEEIGEIMQYWLTDLNDSDVEFITEHHTRFYFAYSEKLGLWVMLVDHWGTAWDYVKISTDLNY